MMRLRAISCAVVFLVAPAVIQAVELTVGVTTGLGLSAWRGWDEFPMTDSLGRTETLDPYEGRSVKPGIDFSLSIGSRFTKWFELASGLGYALKGARYVESVSFLYGTISITTVYNVSYLEVPLYARFLIDGLNGDVAFYLGPVYGLRTSVGGYVKAIYEGDTDRESMPADVRSDMDRMLNRSDFSIAGGIAFQLGSKQTRFVLDFRYVHGLVNVYNNIDPLIEDAMSSGDVDYLAMVEAIGKPEHRNMCVTISIGVRHELGGK